MEYKHCMSMEGIVFIRPRRFAAGECQISDIILQELDTKVRCVNICNTNNLYVYNYVSDYCK